MKKAVKKSNKSNKNISYEKISHDISDSLYYFLTKDGFKVAVDVKEPFVIEFFKNRYNLSDYSTEYIIEKCASLYSQFEIKPNIDSYYLYKECNSDNLDFLLFCSDAQSYCDTEYNRTDAKKIQKRTINNFSRWR